MNDDATTPEPTTDVLAELAAHPFAAGLTAAEVEAVGAGAGLVAPGAGELLTQEGRPADHLYLVVDGHVGLELHVPHRGAVVVGTVGPGELLGWSWLQEGSVWRFDGRARGPVRAIALDAAAVRTACAADHHLDRLVSHQVIRTLASRLEAARHQIVDAYRRDV